MMRALFALVLFLGCAPAAAANGCNGAQVDFEPGAILLATVTAGKVFFHDDDLKRTKAFVLKGDEVLASPSQAVGDEWICITFIGKNGVDTSGFVKASDLMQRPPDRPALADWLGDWTTGKWQNVTLSRGAKPGWINVEGSAFWAMSEETAMTGGLNSGGIGSEAPLKDGRVGFTQTVEGDYKPYSEDAAANLECAVLVQALSRNYLMIQDSGYCGGHNVRFTGLYGRGKVTGLEG